MSHEEIGKLMDRWLEDREFRKALRKDPEGALKNMGSKLTPEEWGALKKIDWMLSDEELESRVNKFFS